MREHFLFQLVLLLVLGAGVPSPTVAQARSDTVAIAEVLAQRFDSLTVRIVVPTACESPRICDPPDSSSAWQAALRSAAPALLVSSSLPPCPWNRGALSGDTGYEMRLFVRNLNSDRAIVYSVRSCRQALGELHAVYRLGEQFEFERDGGEWRLHRSRGRWVT